MKYYSEKLKKLFTTEEELNKAEKIEDKKITEKKQLSETKKIRAKEIEDAYNETIKVREQAFKEIKRVESKYNQLVDNFVKDYGSYHMTYTSDNKNNEITVSDVLYEFFDNFPLI